MADGSADERLIVMLEARIADFEKRMIAAEKRGTKTYNGLQRGSARATAQMEADMMRSTSRINQALASTSGKLGAFGKAFVAGAVTAGLTGIASAARGAIRDMADLADEADRIGVSAEDYQALQFGLGLSGVKASEAAGNLGVFVDRLADAAKGEGDLAAAATKHGIAIKDNQGQMRDTLAILRDYADAVQAAPDAAAKMGLVTDAFGRGGKAMVLAMGEGSAGIDDMMRKARDGGMVIDEDLIRKAAELDDRFDALTTRVGVFFKTIAVNVADAIDQLLSVEGGIRAVLDASTGGKSAQIISPENLAALEANADAAFELAGRLEGLADQYDMTADRAEAASGQMLDTAAALRLVGDEAGADKLAALANELQNTAAQWRNNEIGSDEFKEKLNGVYLRAQDAVHGLDAIEGVTFGGVIGRLGDLWDALQDVATKANEAAAAMPDAPGAVPDFPAQEPGKRSSAVPPSPLAPNTSPRPKPAPNGDGLGASTSSGAGRGGRGGGGSDRVAALLADLQTEREATEAWYAESAQLLAGATDAQLAAFGGRHEAIERLEREHAERLAEIRDGSNSGALASAASFFGSMASLTAAGGNKLVRATRFFGALEAGANVLRAQAQVLADPTLGFLGKLGAYAAIGLAGGNIVSALGGSGGGAGGGGSGGATATPAATATTEKPESPLILRLQGIDPVALYEGKQIIAMADAIQKEFGRRGLTMVTDK